MCQRTNRYDYEVPVCVAMRAFDANVRRFMLFHMLIMLPHRIVYAYMSVPAQADCHFPGCTLLSNSDAGWSCAGFGMVSEHVQAPTQPCKTPWEKYMHPFDFGTYCSWCHGWPRPPPFPSSHLPSQAWTRQGGEAAERIERSTLSVHLVQEFPINLPFCKAS